MTARKVLLLELNEITWSLIDPQIEQGKLPTFAWLKRQGTWAAPVSVDLPPQMDPWITWTTVYTGRPQSEHNVYFLEQPPDTIRARRIWEICHAHGLRVGVYGSLCSWPPQPLNGFYVPDTFAPDSATHPEHLRAIQELNLTYTRSARLPADHDGLMFKARLAASLLALGLKPGSAARIAGQLVHESWNPKARWRRVALQPRVNFDFFERLYRRYRPEFASFHTNHVAHYMHTYWRAMQPDVFPQQATPDEVRTFGPAIAYGYRSADELLKRVLRLLDGQTVLVVASSMGQRPFVSDHRNGKPIAQLRSLDRLLEILDVQGRARALSTMSDQFNIYADTPGTRDRIVDALRAAYVDAPGRPMFFLFSVDNCVTVNLRLDQEISEDARCHFPHRGHLQSFRYHDLVYSTGLVKSGCHDPTGMMLLYGPGIASGGHSAECNNLDLAPTLLTILGLPVPGHMKGRVLAEAVGGAAPSVRRAS